MEKITLLRMAITVESDTEKRPVVSDYLAKRDMQISPTGISSAWIKTKLTTIIFSGNLIFN